MTATLACESACANCGKTLPTPRRLKDFCSYSCRGQQAVAALDGAKYQSGLIGSKNTKRNRALRNLKRQAVGFVTFARINSCTIRIDGANKRGVGWLTEVAWPAGVRQRWVARAGDRLSEPSPLAAAKHAAVVFLREKEKPRTKPNHIDDLNHLAANEVDRAVIHRELKRWPIDLMNGRQLGFVEQRHAIIEAELAMPPDDNPTLEVADYPLDYYADGYPKLPQSLRRRAEHDIDVARAA